MNFHSALLPVSIDGIPHSNQLHFLFTDQNVGSESRRSQVSEANRLNFANLDRSNRPPITTTTYLRLLHSLATDIVKGRSFVFVACEDSLYQV